MSPKEIILELERNKGVFEHLLISTPPKTYLYKTDEHQWCLLEIVCHLRDEEVEDFRARVKHALETADLPLKPIHPTKWPIQRKYLEKDFDTALHDFLEERKASIKWLKTLKNVQWNNSVEIANMGHLSALDFLENWLAHDHLHIRQINRIRRSYLDHDAQSDLSYAGNW